MTEHPCKDVVDFFNNPLRIEDVRKFLNKYLAHHGLPPLAPLVDEPATVPPPPFKQTLWCAVPVPLPAHPCLRTLACAPLPTHPCLRTLACALCGAKP